MKAEIAIQQLNLFVVHSVQYGRKGALRPLLENGINVAFLPAYSLDFNPIELRMVEDKCLPTHGGGYVRSAKS